MFKKLRLCHYFGPFKGDLKTKINRVNYEEIALKLSNTQKKTLDEALLRHAFVIVKVKKNPLFSSDIAYSLNTYSPWILFGLDDAKLN